MPNRLNSIDKKKCDFVATKAHDTLRFFSISIYKYIANKHTSPYIKVLAGNVTCKSTTIRHPFDSNWNTCLPPQPKKTNEDKVFHHVAPVSNFYNRLRT